MKITTQVGTEPAASSLPTWETAYPDLIRPDKIVLIDRFNGTGNLLGRIPDKRPGAELWAGDLTSLVDGAVYPTGTATYQPFINTGAGDIDITVLVTPAATGSVGISFRRTNNYNSFWCAVYPNGGYSTLRRASSGVSTVLGTHTYPFIADADYVLRVKAVGDTIRWWSAGIEQTPIIDTFNQTVTQHGLMFDSSLTHSVKEIVMSYGV